MTQPMDAEMLDALLRLVAVLDRPDEAPVLGPMIVKEIHFRLLLGPNGSHLRSLHSYGTQKSHVALAVGWLRMNFKEPFRVEELAEKVHMSPSTFHRHFKEITSLSPVQFQKRLRLHEAQRLMLAEDFGIAEVCDAVGYENVAQFTREYKRLFGEPPRRDVMRWKRMELSFAVAE
jgi:transcriptional regulator GlxA family with amidase domain